MGRNGFVALVLMVATSMLGLGGCAGARATDTTVEDMAYKTLMSVRLTYEASMPALAEAYGKGLITDDQKARIIAGADRFVGAYRLGVAALAEYVKLKNTESEERLAQALKDMNTWFADFLAVVSPYLIQKEGT